MQAEHGNGIGTRTFHHGDGLSRRSAPTKLTSASRSAFTPASACTRRCQNIDTDKGGNASGIFVMQSWSRWSSARFRGTTVSSSELATTANAFEKCGTVSTTRRVRRSGSNASSTSCPRPGEIWIFTCPRARNCSSVLTGATDRPLTQTNSSRVALPSVSTASSHLRRMHRFDAGRSGSQ